MDRRVAIVTGAARGLGSTVARVFAEEAFTVALGVFAAQAPEL